jgi:molecular chaperone GrpE
MNVIPEWNTAGDMSTAILQSTASGAPAASETPEADAGPDAAETPVRPDGAEASGAAGAPERSGTGTPKTGSGRTPEPGAADASQELMAGIAASVRELADSSERYHARAQQREGVIDHLSAEVDKLRRGERRVLLRPLLVEICRLRNDLLRQAGELPADFDTRRAALLLRSYAESAELTLENSGVVTFAPDCGDAFDPRMHRRVGGEPASEPAFAGRIARVLRDGYLDVDANSPIAPAEVVVFAATVPESTQAERAE